MKNYKITIHVTKSGETEIKEADFGGRTPDESFANLMELAFEMGRDATVERISVMSVEEIPETAATTA